MLTIEGLETYLLQPRDPGDMELLLEAVRSVSSPLDLDVVVGVRGPIASPEMCNGLLVPILIFDQIYSFDRNALIKSIPRPKDIAAKAFEPAAGELFDRLMQLADNAGATDDPASARDVGREGRQRAHRRCARAHTGRGRLGLTSIASR